MEKTDATLTVRVNAEVFHALNAKLRETLALLRQLPAAASAASSAVLTRDVTFESLEALQRETRRALERLRAIAEDRVRSRGVQAQSRDDLAAEVRNCINAVGGMRRQLDDTLEKLRQLWLIAPQMIGEGTIADLELQVKRLDIEEHDVLVLRTAKKLTQDEADAAVDMIESIARRSGIRFVTPVVLDACSDLSIERPAPRLPHES